ncbi:MAG: type I-E CRISPR-associated endoribonuclease Cas2 [Burkholderiaceae bacterium]|nr:type I-E CRISPR-associated endoribonuclease Cas2 [Burkholderiaceae bacterium]
MGLTVLITRDVEDRFRGFLASAMLEASPGVYVSKSLTPKARDKLWRVVSDWHAALGQGSLTLLYPDMSCDGGIAVRTLGTPSRRPVQIDGALLMHRVSTK